MLRPSTQDAVALTQSYKAMLWPGGRRVKVNVGLKGPMGAGDRQAGTPSYLAMKRSCASPIA